MIDIEAKAASIRRKVHLIFDCKQRLGLIEHDLEFAKFEKAYSPQKCRCCHQEMTAKDAYWYQSRCENCEREKFLDKELRKLSPGNAKHVKTVLMFNYQASSAAITH